MNPRVCILKTDGINCDQETLYACQLAGASADIVYMYELRNKLKKLNHYQMLILPGGFSYGDDIASGKVSAVEILSFLQDELELFLTKDTLVLGICNGFQVLVKSGLLPFGTMHKPPAFAEASTGRQATLIDNDSGRFVCKWVPLQIEDTNCIFFSALKEQAIMLPIAHAEGKFLADQSVLEQLEQNKSIVLRYKDVNPNGSLHNIAGICDRTGRIFGLMPHPERFVQTYQHPNWRREQVIPYGLSFFKSAVDYFEG